MAKHYIYDELGNGHLAEYPTGLTAEARRKTTLYFCVDCAEFDKDRSYCPVLRKHISDRRYPHACGYFRE